MHESLLAGQLRRARAEMRPAESKSPTYSSVPKVVAGGDLLPTSGPGPQEAPSADVAVG
jgi:hypothetical protein